MIDGEYYVDESFGGEIEEFINLVKGKEYQCVGCGKFHVAKKFSAVDGGNAGLTDKNGKNHWVFLRCTNTRIAYDNAFWKVQRRLKKETVLN